MKNHSWRKRLLIGFPLTLTLLIAVLLLLREVFFTGAVVPPAPITRGKIIDMHTHIAGIGAGGSGCYISPSLQENFRFKQYLAGFGVTLQELEQHGDSIAVDKIAARLRGSQAVQGVVLLAMDGAVDTQGELDLPRTEIYIPNEYVAAQVKRYPDLFYFGASINPYRKDALTQLEQAKQQGAVLVKWIPNIQHIDPADPTLTAFYQKMRELNLPLLSHTGQERSFSTANDAYGDPKRLELPLSLGVTVIAAHIATTGGNHGEDNYQRILPLLPQYPNLYVDISSLTQVNKLGFLDKALREPRLQGRLLYGSDFPLSNMILTSAWYFPLNLTKEEMHRINNIPNHWDRDVALKQTLGVPPETFTRNAAVLGVQ